MNAAWIVFRKELLDAFRDRKTLAMILFSTVLIGPIMLFALSTIVSKMEEKSEKREVYVVGIERAPELENFLLRQGLTVKTAPTDYEAQLSDYRLGDSVIVVDAEYTQKQARGEAPELRVVHDSANRQSSTTVSRNTGLLTSFSNEQGRLELALRGVAPAVLEPFNVTTRNLASEQSRSSQLTSMVPWIVMMAVLFGGMTVALDTTAGERERTSLEPLLSNPISPLSLVVGKWMAVALMAMTIALLSVAGFLPARHLIQSEALQAMFRFGPSEGAMFLLMLFPLAAAISAILMLTAIFGRTFKEAQTRATLVLFAFQMAPLVAIMDLSGEKPWHLWVPALAQQVVMLRVLRGDALQIEHMVIPTVMCIALTVGCLYFLAYRLKSVAIR